MTGTVKIRRAKISDAAQICELINWYAERGRMLHRSLESTYETLRDFHVAEDQASPGRIVGCAAVHIFWADLAELKSFAISEGWRGKGIGSKLLAAVLTDAGKLGAKRIFALTYETDFFRRNGFEVIDKDSLPEKVWRECISCPRTDACDEIAMLLNLDRRKPGRKRKAAKCRK